MARIDVNKVLTDDDAVLEIAAGTGISLAVTEGQGRAKVTITAAGGGGGSDPDGTTLDLNGSSQLEIKAGGVGTTQLANAGPGATGPVGDGTHVSAVTTDVKGRVTGLTSVAITPTSDATLTTTDVTTNNASTSKHGFAPKLPGGTSTFWRADGTFATPPGSGSSPVWPATGLQTWVDYANGSDSNAGYGPGASDAYKTIQAAYDAMKTYALAHYSDGGKGLGVGQINLLPGTHDVGTALAITNNRPVRLIGAAGRAGTVIHFPSNTAPVIVSSSSAATEMVKISSASAIGYGTEIRDVAFQPNHTTNSSLTKIIYAIKVGNLTVDHCSFSTDDNLTNMSVTAVYHEDAHDSSGEAGWLKLVNCNNSRFQLYKAVTDTGAAGGNFNYGQITGNASFYGGSLPTIHLTANVNHLNCSDNCLEGTATQIQIGDVGVFSANVFINNCGEDDSTGTPPNPFINLTASVSGQIFIATTCTSPYASASGTLIAFGSNAYRNLVLGTFDLTNTTAAYKRIVTETSAVDKNSLIPINLSMPTYTVTNPTTDRGLNVTGDTLPQVAQVLGTLIADLQARGLIK